MGYDLDEANLKPEGSLGLTLYWQTMQPMDASYTVFVHLLDQDNQVRAQKDFVPGNGEMLTSGWMKDEIVSDSAQIDLPPDTPSGEYTLEVGMYNAANGQRLAILDEAGSVISDHIILGQVDIP